MKKLPAIDQVRVSLKEGMTILDLKPDNTVTVTQLRQIIRNSGFVSKEVTARAHGNVSADQKTFTVSGTNETLSLSAIPHQSNGEWNVMVAAPRR